jgi:hypothetical protein
MKRDIDILVKGKPAELGYGDDVAVFENDDVVYSGTSCRAYPSPFRPSDHAPWEQAYAAVLPGEYEYQYYETDQHGPCLLINYGGKVPTRFRNPNKESRHYDTPFADEILFHSGGVGKNPLWPGSAGCLTMHPASWPNFIKIFKKGDSGTIRIRDFKIEPITKGDTMGIIDAVKQYKASKSVAKAVEPPVFVGIISTILISIAKRYGAEIDPETIVMIVTAFYGAFKGFVNWLKHRRDGK